MTDCSYGLDHVHYQWIYEPCEYYHPENESYLIVQLHFPKIVYRSNSCINQLILDLVNVQIQLENLIAGAFDISSEIFTHYFINIWSEL